MEVKVQAWHVTNFISVPDATWSPEHHWVQTLDPPSIGMLTQEIFGMTGPEQYQSSDPSIEPLARLAENVWKGPPDPHLGDPKINKQ